MDFLASQLRAAGYATLPGDTAPVLLSRGADVCTPESDLQLERPAPVWKPSCSIRAATCSGRRRSTTSTARPRRTYSKMHHERGPKTAARTQC